MTSVTQIIKSVCPKLVPFFKTLAIYFVVFIPCNQPSILATILKCLPILALVVFIILHTRSASGSEYKFSKKIITGMLFGCLGDAFLIWPGHFDVGAFSFLIGHLFYIHAFGLKPLKLHVGIICYAVAILGTLIFLKDLHGILVIGAPLYSLVLMTMVWRAIVRVQYTANPWTLSKVCTCIGAISFAVSDFFVGINHFQDVFEYDQHIIMITYYAAQFGIALSVLDVKLEQSLNTEEIQKSQPIVGSRKDD